MGNIYQDILNHLAEDQPVSLETVIRGDKGMIEDGLGRKLTTVTPVTDLKGRSFARVTAESTEDGAIFSVTKAVGGLTDPVLYLAYEVLGYALLNAPGAPLRDALIKEGIGTEVYGGYDSSCLTPVFSVTVRNADPEDFERFIIEKQEFLEAQKAAGEED